MDRALLEKFITPSEEEKRILAGEPLDIRQYTQGEGSVIREDKMTGGKGDIAMRMHTRFAPFPTHSHNFIEIMTVISGTITHNIGKKRVILEEGDFLFMNKHVCHSIEKAGERDVGINVIISDSFLGAVISSLSATAFSGFVKENSKSGGAPMFLHFKARGVKQIENLTENLLFELDSPSPDRTVAARTLSLLLNYLFLKNAELLVGGPIPVSKEEERRQKILSYVRGSYASATLFELSEKVYLTVPHLSKLVKAYFGKSFKELLVSERLERAATLILESDMQIGSIIRSVGYENESYFHREFKKKYGKTPLEMRKSNKFNTDLT